MSCTCSIELVEYCNVKHGFATTNKPNPSIPNANTCVLALWLSKGWQSSALCSEGGQGRDIEVDLITQVVCECCILVKHVQSLHPSQARVLQNEQGAIWKPWRECQLLLQNCKSLSLSIVTLARTCSLDQLSHVYFCTLAQGSSCVKTNRFDPTTIRKA